MPAPAFAFHDLLLAGPLLGSLLAADADAVSAGQAWLPLLWPMGALLLAAGLWGFGWRYWRGGR